MGRSSNLDHEGMEVSRCSHSFHYVKRRPVVIGTVRKEKEG